MVRVISILILVFFFLAACAGPAVTPTKSAPEHFRTGKAMVEKKDYEAAIMEFKKAIAADPDFVEARYELGRAYMWGYSDYDQAIVQFRKILEINPNHPGSHYELGLIHYLTWDYYHRLNEASKKEESPEAAKELQQAIDHYKRTLDLDPNFAMAYNNLGVIYTEQGDISQAIAMFEKAVKLLADQYQIHGNLGYLYYKQGENRDALAHFKEHVRLTREQHQQGHQTENILKLIKSLEEKGIK